jgi:hypothetical protein
MANVKTKYSVSIDLSKIDKTRIVSTDKKGQPFQNGAKYYNIEVIVFDEASQYGSDVMVTEGQTKEERDNKVKSKAIGNGKTIYTTQSQTTTPQPNNRPNQAMLQPSPPSPPSFMDGSESDSLPF